MTKIIWLKRRSEKNKEALLKNKLAHLKRALYLSALRRKRRKNLLIRCGNFFKKTASDNDVAAGKIRTDK